MGERVGFIGLGNMGAPIAANLIASGCDVSVYNRTTSKADPLVEKELPGPAGLALALAASDETGVPMPVASLLRDRLLTALARGRQDLDWSALAIGAREDAGLS